MLANEPGVDAYGKNLEQSHYYIYAVANRAMRMMGIQTTHSPQELRAFSHGFAGFETMSDLVHEPRMYATAPAARRAAELLIDTRSLSDIEREAKLATPADDDDEIIGEGPHRLLLTPAMHDALRGIPSLPYGEATGHDKRDIEAVFTERHTLLAQKYPRTFDVIVSMGEARNETMAQLQLRIAGASLARTLQAED